MSIKVNTWDDISPIFEDLKQQEVGTKDELLLWMKEVNKLESALEENLAWRYIKMTIDTTNKDLSQAYSYFVTEIQPKIAPYDNDFNKKLIASEALGQLDQERFKNYIRSVKNQLEIFREENIPLQAKDSEKSQEQGAIAGKQTITYNGEELTLQQASKLLQNTNREIRKEVYELIGERRSQDVDALNNLYTELIDLRTKIAKNAGFENYRDYKFKSMGRFDYTPEHCFKFHEAVKEVLMPLSQKIIAERKEKLGYDTLKPYDLAVDVEGREQLSPFNTSDELVDKTINIFTEIRPFFGECIKTMKEKGHLDLASKKGKAPGGYNYPLYESGYPFIFMNAVGSQRDLITMVHEGGHAIHSVLTKDLPYVSDKSFPSEVAELASMSMELISMDYWDEFYTNEDDLKRAKREHIEDIFSVLPWVSTIDKFQHWVYENPNHSKEERKNAWLSDKCKSKPQ